MNVGMYVCMYFTRRIELSEPCLYNKDALKGTNLGDGVV